MHKNVHKKVIVFGFRGKGLLDTLPEFVALPEDFSLFQYIM
jgi:hypothetical protein